jgi:hypothetical protein
MKNPLRRILVAAVVLLASDAAALDVTGNWSITGATASGVSSVSFVQTGTTLTACLSGYGTAATGTVDLTTGAFTLWFDTDALPPPEFGLCGLEWSGTFAPDGGSLSGSETDSSRCALFPGSCCLPPQTRAITGTRVAPTVTCCGNGIVEPGEQCDTPPNGNESCCSSACSYASAGTFCGADDACHPKECDGAGTCTNAPPADCPACYTCDPVDGCVADIRNDCRVGGSGTRVSVRRATLSSAPALDWTWREGSSPETTPADLGDPLTTTSYEFCVFTYDVLPSGFPHYAALMAPDADCTDRSCWRPRSDGFRYKGAGTPSGVKSVLVRARSARRSFLKMKGKGVPVFPPLTEPVIVQLSAQDGDPSRCWSNAFTGASENSSEKYVATIP